MIEIIKSGAFWRVLLGIAIGVAVGGACFAIGLEWEEVAKSSWRHDLLPMFNSAENDIVKMYDLPFGLWSIHIIVNVILSVFKYIILSAVLFGWQVLTPMSLFVGIIAILFAVAWIEQINDRIKSK